MPDHFPRREYRCRPGHHRLGCGGSTPPSRRGSFSGLQALQRCSGLLSRRARGSTVATHHSQRSRSSKYQSATLRTSWLQVRVLPGVPISRACGSTRNSRGSRLRIWQPWGCNSLHAHHFAATGLSGNSRPRRLKIAAPSGCKSRVADRRVVYRE
jgi:hypothetical protein